MRKFHTVVDLSCPPGQVWTAMRDHLTELTVGLPDVNSVTEYERQDFPGLTKITNEWEVKFPIPMMVRTVLGNGTIGWAASNEWDERTRICSWQILPFFMPDHLTCQGRTIFEPARDGKGARVTIEGALDLKPGFFGRHGAIAERLLSGVLESAVSNAVPKNMTAVLHRAAAFDPNKAGSNRP